MFRSILTKLIIPVGIVFGIGCIIFLSLPYIIDAFILPSLLEQTPFAASHASVSRLTPYELSGRVDLRQNDRPALSIPRFSLHFTPGALLRKQIDALELSHAVFHIYQEADGWVLPGLNRQRSSQPKPSAPEPLYLVPLGVDRLQLHRCLFVIHDHSGREFHIGADALLEPEFTPVAEKRLLESVAGSLQLYDDIGAAVSFRVSAGDDAVHVMVEMENGNSFVPRNNLPDLLKSFAFNSLSARLNAELDAATFALNRYELSGRFADIRFNTERFGMGGGADSPGVTFLLSGSAHEHQYELNALSLLAPVPATLNIGGAASYRNSTLRTEGKLDASVTLAAEPDQVPVPVSLSYRGNWTEPGAYRFSIAGSARSDQPFRLSNSASISGLDDLQFSGIAAGDRNKTEAEFRLSSPPLTIELSDRSMQTSAFAMDGSVLKIDNDFAAHMRGSLASIDVPGDNFRLEQLEFSLPYAATPLLSGHFPEGALSVDSFLFNGERLAGLSASLHQNNAGYSGTGSLSALFTPDLELTFAADLAPLSGNGLITWDLPAVLLSPESLPAQVSLPIDLDFSGTVAASGTVSLNDFDISAEMKASLADASLEMSDSGLSIKEISCMVEFPELPRFTSSPSQLCRTGAIDLASLHFDDAKLSFRVEDQHSLFIEKSRFGWCGGKLDSGSMRLSADRQELDTTLYCSRINLGSLLEQFGFSGTEGEGSLNGMLPIRISRDSLEFDDGFLFSTPGTGGIVRFTDTGLLRQGMGAVSETGYVSYSLAALEDFTYNWTKLSFNSSDDDLLLTLELDGKPASPLPFKFDKKGMIVESDTGQGLQYPIRLDVNFKLPLTELFKIGQSINSLMGNSQ